MLVSPCSMLFLRYDILTLEQYLLSAKAIPKTAVKQQRTAAERQKREFSLSFILLSKRYFKEKSPANKKQIYGIKKVLAPMGETAKRGAAEITPEKTAMAEILYLNSTFFPAMSSMLVKITASA